MNREELISAIAEKSGATKTDSAAVLKAFISTVQEAVASGQEVSITGFGKWGSTKRSARTGRNPLTGETIQIAARTVPSFKAGKSFKSLVSEN